MSKRILRNFSIFLVVFTLVVSFVNCEDEQPEKPLTQLITKSLQFTIDTLTEQM